MCKVAHLYCISCPEGQKSKEKNRGLSSFADQIMWKVLGWVAGVVVGNQIVDNSHNIRLVEVIIYFS